MRLRTNIITAALALGLILSARATLIDFNSTASFQSLSFYNQNATLGYGSTEGAGGTGGAVFQPSTGGDVRVLASTGSVGSGASASGFTMSLRMNAGDMIGYLDTDPFDPTLPENAGVNKYEVKGKAKVRFGLASDVTVPVVSGEAKPQELWKTAANFNLEFEMKYEYVWERKNAGLPTESIKEETKIENKLAAKGWNGSAEIKGADLKNSDTSFWGDWIELRLDVAYVGELSGNPFYQITVSLVSLGEDGLATAEPVSGFTYTPVLGANAAYAGAENLYAVLMVEGEKETTTRFVVDDFTYATVPEPGALALLGLGAGFWLLRRRLVRDPR